MRAAVMHAVGEPLTLREVPVPRIGPGEALVETRTCGICGTDLHILAGHGYVPPLPHILGHEPAGVVAEVGEGVTNVRPGDRVAPHLFFNCGRCYFCRVGRQQQCTDLKGILGVLCPGAFADYFKIPAENLLPLPDNVPFDVGGLVADAVLTSVHAVKRAQLALGDSTVIIGAGGIGQVLTQILTASGIGVIATARGAEKRKLVEQMGAALALPTSGAQTRDAILERFPGGVGCVFDCVGTAQSMSDAASYLMRGGRIVVIGEEPEFPAIDTIQIAQRELEITGSRNGTRQDMVEAIRLLESGVVKPHVAARFPLEQVNEALQATRQGSTGRVVVVVKE
jgi:D-arabinose 1-dehydrogenase-like Zn-dependent alcohol dehydrogenase